jgi:hypothetical protein
MAFSGRHEDHAGYSKDHGQLLIVRCAIVRSISSIYRF